jgi:hypothetical protein
MVEGDNLPIDVAVSPSGRTKYGSPVHPLTKMSLHPRLTRAHAAQGGVSLRLEQGELEAEFRSSWRIRRGGERGSGDPLTWMA